MNNLELLWDFQTAELELENFENELKNTQTRKKLVAQQQIFNANQQKLKQLEQESILNQSKISEISVQIEQLAKQMEQKQTEIAEVEDLDLEDVFVEDVREMGKECDSVKNALELNKRKLVEIIHRLEQSEAEVKETLVKMSNAKKHFDQLKEAHAKELDSGKDDLERLRGEVAKAAQGIDEALMAQYKKIKQHRHNPVAIFKDNRCQGCNMQLPSSVLQNLKNDDKIITCENCGRILFVQE